jgi:sugar O-acyltransferase (sialic acid O-acetyltransferase NeuD family)
MKHLYLFGAGGWGREVAASIQAQPEWQVIGFFDDTLKKDTIVSDIKVVGGIHELMHWPEPINVLITIADPTTRISIIDKLKNIDTITYPIIIHPSVIILNKDTVTIGEGSVIAAGVILTCNITVGKHVLLNLKTTVGHDVHVGTGCSIMPGANIAGSVVLQEGVLIGSGANILNGKQIGGFAKIGSGAVVLHDIPTKATAVGVPAIIKKYG